MRHKVNRREEITDVPHIPIYFVMNKVESRSLTVRALKYTMNNAVLCAIAKRTYDMASSESLEVKNRTFEWK